MERASETQTTSHVDDEVQALQLPSIAHDLYHLLDSGARFSTIYADPPWQYSNTAARGAAQNHYATISVSELCEMPVKKLAARDSHLHLWTTNGFLPEAFRVMAAWGFTYKSCFVWIKPQLGMGNYWRVSHEFLLFGIRGCLPFLDNTQRSWLMKRRRRHSSKPYAVREAIEKVSPGPYLELFGREEIPNSAWTVYGNQVERRLF